jgi:hypothetical protein
MPELGYWNERSAKLLPAGDYILAGKPYRAYSIMKGGKIVGTMRRNCEGWMVTIPGYHFYTVPGQGASRHGMKETIVKNFKTSAMARAAIKRAFSELEITHA